MLHGRAAPVTGIVRAVRGVVEYPIDESAAIQPVGVVCAGGRAAICPHLLKLAPATIPALFVSVAVNCALSCELLLKSMLPQGTKGHKLDELFNKLDASDRTFIKESVVRILSDMGEANAEDNFDEELQKNADTFVAWRYFHESGGNLTYNYQFMYVFQATIKALATTLAKDQTNS